MIQTLNASHYVPLSEAVQRTGIGASELAERHDFAFLNLSDGRRVRETDVARYEWKRKERELDEWIAASWRPHNLRRMIAEDKEYLASPPVQAAPLHRDEVERRIREQEQRLQQELDTALAAVPRSDDPYHLERLRQVDRLAANRRAAKR